MSGPVNNLMSMSMPAQLASIIGMTPSTLTTTGTSAGTAATITTRMVSLNTAGSQTGAILPTPTTANPLGGPGDMFFIGCPTATTGIVYPPTGATINAGASLSVAQNKAAIVWVQSPTVMFAVLLA